MRFLSILIEDFDDFLKIWFFNLLMLWGFMNLFISQRLLTNKIPMWLCICLVVLKSSTLLTLWVAIVCFTEESSRVWSLKVTSTGLMALEGHDNIHFQLSGRKVQGWGLLLLSVTEDVVFPLLNAYKHQHYLIGSRTILPLLLDTAGRQNSFSSSVFMSLEVRRKAELHLRDLIWAGKKILPLLNCCVHKI